MPREQVDEREAPQRLRRDLFVAPAPLVIELLEQCLRAAELERPDEGSRERESVPRTLPGVGLCGRELIALLPKQQRIRPRHMKMDRREDVEPRSTQAVVAHTLRDRDARPRVPLGRFEPLLEEDVPRKLAMEAALQAWVVLCFVDRLPPVVDGHPYVRCELP